MMWLQIGVLALLASCGKGSGGSDSSQVPVDEVNQENEDTSSEQEASDIESFGSDEKKLKNIEVFVQKKGTPVEIDPANVSYPRGPYKPLAISSLTQAKEQEPVSSIWDFSLFGPSFKFPLKPKEVDKTEVKRNGKKYFTHQALWSPALKDKLLKLSRNDFSLKSVPSTGEILGLQPKPNYQLNLKVSLPKEKNEFAEQIVQFAEKKAKFPTVDSFLEAMDSPENCSLERAKQVVPTYDSQASSPWCFAFSAARGLNPLLGPEKVSYYYLSALSNFSLNPTKDLSFNLLGGGNDFRPLLEMQRSGFYYSEKDIPFDGDLPGALNRVLDTIWLQPDSLPSEISVKGRIYEFKLSKTLLLELKSKSPTRHDFYKQAEEVILVKLSSVVNVDKLPKIKLPDFSIKFWTLDKLRDQHPREDLVVKFFDELRQVLASGQRVMLGECANNLYKFDKDAKDTPSNEFCEDHAISLAGLYWDKTEQKCMTTIENSWGTSFGNNGVQAISLEEFLRSWQEPKNLLAAVKSLQYRFTTLSPSSKPNEYLSVAKNGDIYANSFKHSAAKGSMFQGQGQGQELFIKGNNSLRILKGAFQAGKMSRGDTYTFDSLNSFNLNSAKWASIQSAEVDKETILNEFSKVTHHGVFKGSVLVEGLDVTYYPSGSVKNLFEGKSDGSGTREHGVYITFSESGQLNTYEEGEFGKFGLSQGVSLLFEDGVIKNYKIFALDSDKRQVQLFVTFNSDGTLKNDSLLTYVNKNPQFGYKRSTKEGKLYSFRTLVNGAELKHPIEDVQTPSPSSKKPIKEEATDLLNSVLDIWTTKPRAKNPTTN